MFRFNQSFLIHVDQIEMQIGMIVDRIDLERSPTAANRRFDLAHVPVGHGHVVQDIRKVGPEPEGLFVLFDRRFGAAQGPQPQPQVVEDHVGIGPERYGLLVRIDRRLEVTQFLFQQPQLEIGIKIIRLNRNGTAKGLHGLLFGSNNPQAKAHVVMGYC
nr:hypothetical protein [Geothrix sp.]